MDTSRRKGIVMGAEREGKERERESRRRRDQACPKGVGQADGKTGRLPACLHSGPFSKVSSSRWIAAEKTKIAQRHSRS
jgi:hypothetical protein